eukprot:1140246-Pelagomonas_calceolata.AAC.1
MYDAPTNGAPGAVEGRKSVGRQELGPLAQRLACLVQTACPEFTARECSDSTRKHINRLHRLQLSGKPLIASATAKIGLQGLAKRVACMHIPGTASSKCTSRECSNSWKEHITRPLIACTLHQTTVCECHFRDGAATSRKCNFQGEKDMDA